jgi:hypothetical protein
MSKRLGQMLLAVVILKSDAAGGMICGQLVIVDYHFGSC